MKMVGHIRLDHMIILRYVVCLLHHVIKPKRRGGVTDNTHTPDQMLFFFQTFSLTSTKIQGPLFAPWNGGCEIFFEGAKTKRCVSDI